MASENDLRQIATQHGLGRPLPDYIPDEVRTVANDWCRTNNVTVTIGNAAEVYKHLRQHFNEHLDI